MGNVFAGLENDGIIPLRDANGSTSDFIVKQEDQLVYDNLNHVDLPCSPKVREDLAPMISPGDVGTVQFSSAAYRVHERDNFATITVTRTGGVAGGVTVEYATNGESATAGTDYVATTGLLTFGAGEMQKMLTIPILRDTIPEDDEVVSVILRNPGGGAKLGSPSQATLTIRDRVAWHVAGSVTVTAGPVTDSFALDANLSPSGDNRAAVCLQGGSCNLQIIPDPAPGAKPMFAVTLLIGIVFDGELICTGTATGTGPLVELPIGFSVSGTIAGTDCLFGEPITGSFTAQASK